ncbi:DUF805 domain-containing protein [uncultured Dokdonia sp.]|uniref:DUF805 domain-containing protein n=1 Tax=uncultured Dokdonia sp. TaxID=575653 RepID=UPI0026258257|nr:DUF805 domain-containing protein [uncultured Dokdonia sp.]
MNRYVEAFKRYAEFNGRSRREEYWMFIVFNFLFSIVAFALDHIFGIALREIGYGPVYILYGLVAFIPGLALSVRRLHDVGKSGWMLLIALIPLIGAIWLLVLFATEGEATDNQYGPNPKATYDHIGETTQEVATGSDHLILFVVIWLVFSRFFYFLIPIVDIDFYSTEVYRIISVLFSIIWGAIPVVLALSIKDKKKQTILFVLAGIYALMTIIEIVQNFTGSFFY